MGDPPASGLDSFVGRLDELAELRSALRAAADGSGAVHLIAGEPGIGKTRLAREVAGQAERDGFAIGWGRTWEAGGAPPYWPWTRALRELLQQHDADDLREAFRAAPAATVLLPEIAQLDGQPVFEAVPAQQTADERFAVFEAVSTLLAALGRRRPALVVLEDVHAADEPSLLLLQFIAADVRAAPVVVLATFRDAEARQDERRAALVGEIARQASVLHLSGLPPDESRSLVEARLAQSCDEEFLSDVHDATSGNPFFIEELLRLRRSGSAQDAPIPLGVRATVRSRLDLVPAQTHEALRTAAVYGRSFDELILGRILDRPAEEVSDLLRPALRAALVVRDSDELRFRHGLIREVLVDEVPAAERATIHARIVQVLELLPALTRERHLSELAHHAVRAASGNAQRAVFHAQNAGDAAMRAFAFEEAARHYEGALQAVAVTGSDATVALDLLVGLVKARAGAGDVAGARDAAREAHALASSAGSPQHLAAAALGYPSMAMAVWRIDEDHLAMLREAVAALGDDGDPALRSRLLSSLVVESYFARVPMADLARQAVVLAEASGDPVALAHAHYALHHTTRDNPQTRALLEQDQTVELARRSGDVALEATVRRWLIGHWMQVGSASRADSEIVAYEELIARTRRPIDVWWTKVIRAMRSTYAGRYAEAEHQVRDAVDYGFRFAGHQALSVFGAQDYLAHLDRRPWEQLLSALHALPDDFRQRLPVRAALARTHAAIGQQERARDELAEFAARDYALLPRDRSRHSCLVQLADAAADIGDVERAEELAQMLARYPGRLAMAAPFAIFGPFDLCRGRLLHLLGRYEQAAEAFEAAIRLCARTDGRPYAARSRFHYAALLSDHGEVDRARELLVRARDEAGALGLVLLETAATTALEGLAPTPAPPVAHSNGANDRVRMSLEGEYWSIDSGGRTVRLRDSKGLHYLSRLIGSAGRDIHVLELVSGTGVARPLPGAHELALAGDDLGPVLDERAKAEYRRRIEQLQQEIDDATQARDDERAALARAEHDVFVSELSRALGLHGRDRRTGSVAEQARINVSKGVKAAIRRVREQDRELGAELEAAVRTGLFCTYLPLAGHRRWEVTPQT